MNSFLYFSGIVLWALIIIYIALRLIYGKHWMQKAGLNLVVGSGLVNAFKKLYTEIPQRDIKKETLAEVSAHLVWRLTRIAAVGMAIALMPIWLFFNQNLLLERQNNLLTAQNDKFNLQNNLIEADRRGALVILMSNILDQVDAEINEQKRNSDFADSLGYSLSEPLIGRIAALSQGFLPYRYLEGDTLTERAVSPERGQLLLALVKSELDSVTMGKIYNGATFEGVFLRDTDLRGENLSAADLSSANLIGANLIGTYLIGADLNSANLIGTYLIGADLSSANLRGANLIGASLIGASLKDTDLTGVNLKDANLIGADLRKANLSGAYLKNADLKDADLKDANLRDANLSNTQNLTINQLLKARSLYNCRNLDPELEKKLRKEKPCLFTGEGCPNRYGR